MNPKPELGSPITMDSPNENKVRGELHTSSFVKFCHPYKSSLRRFFVGLEPMWSEINAIEFTEDLPVGYVRETTMPAEVSVHRLVQTSHPNLVNLREVFIADGSAFFVYEKWGISLAEIYRLSPLFQLGEIEVATICREVCTPGSILQRRVANQSRPSKVYNTSTIQLALLTANWRIATYTSWRMVMSSLVNLPHAARHNCLTSGQQMLEKVCWQGQTAKEELRT